MTTLDDIILQQQKMREYLYAKPRASPLQWFILLGERSIGKTHFIMEEMYKSVKEKNSAFMIIVRKRNQTSDITAMCDKYGAVVSGGKLWKADRGRILEGDPETKEVKTIGYYEYLNAADNKKTANYDNPYVSDIFYDEIFSYQPVRDEYRKLMLFRGTVSRRFGKPITDTTIWTAGNLDMGVSPILAELKVDTSRAKWRNDNIALYNSDLKSPDASLNITFSMVEDKGIPKDKPIAVWSYLGKGYEMYQFENHLYCLEAKKSYPPLNADTVKFLIRAVVNQKSIIRPIIYQNAKCLHIAEFLKLKIF